MLTISVRSVSGHANHEVRIRRRWLEPSAREFVGDGQPQAILRERVLLVGHAVGADERTDFDIERPILAEVLVTIEVHAGLCRRSSRQRQKGSNDQGTQHGSRTSEADAVVNRLSHMAVSSSEEMRPLRMAIALHTIARRADTIGAMSVASHLAVSPAKYDARIRSLIPLYDELISEVARALDYASHPVRTIVDLGIGTGALARACLARVPAARVWGIDADEQMMAVARTRLGQLSRRVTMTSGNFLDEALPPCDAIVASYSLHHIRSRRAKGAFYRRCYHALRPGGVLINGDCAPASTPRGVARDLDVWHTHLAKTFGSRARGRRVYESWADEDVYVPLEEEARLLTRAGFTVDVPWRRSPFAVIVGYRSA